MNSIDFKKMKKQILNRVAAIGAVVAFCVSHSLAANVSYAREDESSACFPEPQVRSSVSLADMQSDIVMVRSLIASGKVKEAKAMVAGFNRRYPKSDVFKNVDFALLSQNNPTEWERWARKTIDSTHKETGVLLNFCMTCSNLVGIGASPKVIAKGIEMVLAIEESDPAVLFFAGAFYVKVGAFKKASALFHRASEQISVQGKKVNPLLRSQIEMAKKNWSQFNGD